MSQKEIINAAIKEKESLIKQVNRELWENPEGSFQEYKTGEILMNALKNEGFVLENPVGGMPTAFVATYGSGKPVIGIAADLDALPDLSQERGNTARTPVQAQSHGHGCGHSAIGAGALAGALAAKDWLVRTKSPGTLKFYGCPAEEGGAGKVFMIRAGVFRDADAVFTWHPGTGNGVSAHSMISIVSVDFFFEGTSAHAALEPHLGRSALDAAELMNIGVNYLREHIIPGARIHYAYGDTGGKAANVVQSHASLHYIIRAPKIAQVAALFTRVQAIAAGAALMTETTTHHRVLSSSADYRPNVVLTRILAEAYEEIGPPPFDEGDFAVARRFFPALSAVSQASAQEAISARYGRDRLAEILTKPLDTELKPLTLELDVYAPASTDFGDVSYLVPTAQAGAAVAAIGTPLHSWQFTGQVGTSIGEKAVLTIGRVLALATAKVFAAPDIVQKAKQELDENLSGTYTSLIPEGATPAFDM
jgi:aminobenzoyl-glutamate utilization protein B